MIGVTERLGGTGVWEAAMRFGDPAATGDYAAEVEELGYSAVWIPDVDGDLFGALGSLLASTSSITVASRIDPSTAKGMLRAGSRASPARFTGF